MSWTSSTDLDDTAALLAAVASARRDVEALRTAVARGTEGHAALGAAEWRLHCALRSVDRARAAGRTARLALAMEVHDELGGDAA